MKFKKNSQTLLEHRLHLVRSIKAGFTCIKRAQNFDRNLKFLSKFFCDFCRLKKSFIFAKKENQNYTIIQFVVMNTYNHIISINPQKRFGKPCVRETRITVYDVLGWLSAGMTYDEIIADFPELTREDIFACLAFASQRERFLQHA